MWKMGYPGFEQSIPEPDDFSIVPVELSVSMRMASGRMVKEIKGVKNHYNIRYDALDPEDVKLFRGFYEDGRPVAFIYPDSGEAETRTVFIREFPRNLFVPEPQYSENIHIVLEEQ